MRTAAQSVWPVAVACSWAAYRLPHALPALAFHYAKPPDACGALMIRLRQHGDAADRLILAKGAAEDRCGVGGHFRVRLSAGGFEGIQG